MWKAVACGSSNSCISDIIGRFIMDGDRVKPGY